MLCATALHDVPCHCAMCFFAAALCFMPWQFFCTMALCSVPWLCILPLCSGAVFVPWHCVMCRGIALHDVLQHLVACCSVAQCVAALRGVPKQGFLCGGTAIRVAALLFWCHSIVPCAFFCVLALWLVPWHCAWVPWCCASCHMLHVVPHHCPCPGCGHFLQF